MGQPADAASLCSSPQLWWSFSAAHSVLFVDTHMRYTYRKINNANTLGSLRCVAVTQRLHGTLSHSYLVHMARPHRLRSVSIEKFAKAKWYLAQGYPISMVAERLGVSRGTIHNWSKRLGTSKTASQLGLSVGETRIINICLSQSRRLSLKARKALIRELISEVSK